MSKNYDLEFSQEGFFASAIYYEDLNDITIYVEDKEKKSEALYETIFKRLLKNKYNIAKIFLAGGKIAVIDKYREKYHVKDEKLNIFIVDGDFDRILHPKAMINDTNFIYLRKYNIESYLVDENACYSFVKSKINSIDEIVHSKVNFKYWLERIVAESKELFFCYLFIQANGIREKNTGRNVYEFIDDKTGFKRKDECFYSKIFSDYPRMNITVDFIKENYNRNFGSDYSNLICGKFLLTSLCCYLKKKCSIQIRYDDFVWWLATNFDIDSLSYVREQIDCAYKNYEHEKKLSSILQKELS